MKVHLRVIEGKPQGATIPVPGPTFLIGRDPACQLRPKSEEVEPKHCRLSVHNDHVSVRDLGSEGGTLLNGRRLSPADSVIALNGDQLQVANLVFEVAIPVQSANTGLLDEDEPGEDSPAAIANRLLQRNMAQGPDPGRNIGTHLHVESVEGLPVVRVDIPRLVDDGVVPLRRELRNLAERPALSKVVLDFQKVRRMSTEAAGVLLAFRERIASNHGAVVKLCDVAPEVLRVLEATGVTDKIPIAFDVQDAIWSSW
jgi:anti-anti-sigma factor